jgi:hypothetical protein
VSYFHPALNYIIFCFYLLSSYASKFYLSTLFI